MPLRQTLANTLRRLRRRREQQLLELESELSLFGEKLPIRSPLTPARADPGSLPQPAFGVLELLSHRDQLGRDIREQIDDRTARELWSRTLELGHSLEQRGLVPAVGEEPGFRAFSLLSAAIADGTRYADLPLNRWLSNDSDAVWQGALAGTSGWRGRLLTLELFAVSAWAVLTKDLRSAAFIARQPIEHGFRGFCRHYALAMQALFSCARRVDSGLSSWLVLSVHGRPHPGVPAGHAWNWLVSRETGGIFAFDLTGADWLLDRGGAPNVFNPAFDATRWWNASNFALNVAVAYAMPDCLGYREPALREAFASMVRGHSLAGQALLQRITAQGLFPTSIERRIVEELDRRGFHRLRPSRLEIAPRVRSLKPCMPEALNELLDAVF